MATAEEILLRDDTSILTITGPGGVGKTRIGVEVARNVAGRFADGVRLIPLASVRDPDLLLGTISESIGVRVPRERVFETLRARLQDRQLLLFLDNFEQVVDAAPRLSELLSVLPGLKLLVTSREVLRLHGEREYVVSPLRCPDPGDLPADYEEVEGYPAIEFFVNRARWIEPDFHLNESNAADVAEICARLDGLPLAIELAAARLKILSPRGILLRLEQHGLRLLSGGAADLPGRQRTLYDTMEWSHGLLDEDERRLFRRLSVFVRGCSPEAIEAISDYVDGSFEKVLEGLASLADKSLLRRTALESGAVRLGMLETVREYALGRLEASEEEVEVRNAHATYYLSLAEETSQRSSKWWSQKLEIEHGNLRAALAWTFTCGRAEDATRLGAALWRFWSLGGHREEGYLWLEKILGIANKAPAQARAKVLEGTMVLALSLDKHDRAAELGEERLALARDVGDEHGIAAALDALGHLRRIAGDLEGARCFYEGSLACERKLGDTSGIVKSLNNLGMAAVSQEDLLQAEIFFTKALSERRPQSARRSPAEPVEEPASKQDSEQDVEHPNQAESSTTSFRVLSEIAKPSDERELAERLWDAAESLRGTIDTPLSCEEALTQSALEAIRPTSEEQDRAVSEPENLTEMPHRGDALRGVRSEAIASQASLTSRELEVLRLVARGLTDAQVAQELYISTRTVNAHLRSVYAKLGAASRSVAVKLARDHGLV